MKVNLVNSNIKKDYVCTLLKERGIDKVDEFYNPDSKALENPYNLLNIEKGIELYESVVFNKDSKILLIIDSDLDGYTSAAIIYLYTKNLNQKANIDYIIHKGKEHGLRDLMNKIKDFNFDYNLIIAPDSSTNDYEYIEQLKEYNLPVLILDHHILEKDTKISDNCVLINNQISTNYNNKSLSGAGVTFQFCRALDIKNNTNYAKNYVDLAAVGVIGDVMSGLEIENQYLWKLGLNNINNLFLKELINKQDYSMGGKINPTTIAFYIVPLVNAMIRVGTQEEKDRMFQAFIDGDKLVPSNKRGNKGNLEKLAIESVRECVNAKSKQDKMLERAMEQMEIKIFNYDLLENKIIIIKLDEEDTFPSELNGLLAMRVCAKYKRPTIVGRLNNEGYIRGSMRDSSNSPIKSFKDFLMESGYFEYVLGHSKAAGISFKKKDLEKIYEYANDKLKDVKIDEKCFDVNFERAAAEKDIEDIIEDVNKYEDIWSQNCSEPLIYIHDINLNKDDIVIMGKNKDTIKFTKFDITYIKFKAKEFIENLEQFNKEIKIEIVGRCKVNEWMGHYTNQIIIDAYEISDGTYSF